MRVTLPEDVSAAVNRLKMSRDYEILRTWLAGEFDKEVMGLIHGDASTDTYVKMGKSRVFQYVLTVMQGGDNG